MKLKKYDQAIPFLKEAIRLNPDSHEPYYNIGICFEKLGDIGNAIQSYERALVLQNRSSKINYSLARLLNTHGNKSRALVVYKQL